jgi:hypothetical protein
MITDRWFKITSEAALCADLNAFCDYAGDPRISEDGQHMPGTYTTNLVRIDFHVFSFVFGRTFNDDGSPRQPGVDGLYCNARMSILTSLEPSSAARAPAVVTATLAGLDAWFGQAGTTLTAPVEGLFDGTYPVLPSGSVLISTPPSSPFPGWA